MINQPDILDALVERFETEQAIALAHAISNAVEQGTKEMVDRKDLDIIAARTEAKIEKTLHAQTRWVIVTIAAGIGILATVLKFF